MLTNSIIRRLRSGSRILLLIGAGIASTDAMAEPACLYRAGAATIALPGSPFAAEPSADGCWLYVSLSRGQSGAGGAVAVLQNDNGAFVVRRTLAVDGDPAGLRLTHDGKLLLLADGDGIAAFDAAALQRGAKNPEAGRITVGAGTIYIVISKDDRTAFASEEGAARVAVIDLERGRNGEFGSSAVLGRIPTGLRPVGLALSSKGDKLFATSERAPDSLGLTAHCPAEGKRGGGRMVPEGLLSVIDVDRARSNPRSATLASWLAGCSPVRVVVQADDSVAWISARNEDAVYRFDLSALDGADRRALRRRFDVGPAPVGLALAPDGDALWVANSNRFASAEPGTVERMALLDDARGVLPTGRFPRDLVFLPDGSSLVVAVFGSSQLQFVPTASREGMRH